jgi:predicted glutamine amidotransferase
MCRFVAYISKQPILIYDVLSQPDNSLIKQSKHAKQGRLGLNADGFIGHVRAATIGDVNISNNHPFRYKKFLFAHNGTIHKFCNIKRRFISSLSDEIFSSIKGQTDSECLFALIMENLYKRKVNITLDAISEAVQLSINQLVFMQNRYNSTSSFKINSILTDGKNLIATRYVSYNNNPALSLYYFVRKKRINEVEFIESVTISSEPLSSSERGWREVPLNHMLLVDENLNVSQSPIKNISLYESNEFVIKNEA